MFERRCLGCNEKKDKKFLIKITKDHKSGEIIINPESTKFGRSAYICKSETCINTAFKKDKLFKNLKANISTEEKENIRGVLNTMVVVQH